MVMWNPWTGQGDCRTFSCEEELDRRLYKEYQDMLNRSKHKCVRCKLPRFGPTVKKNGPNLDFFDELFKEGELKEIKLKMGCIRKKPRIRRYLRKIY